MAQSLLVLPQARPLATQLGVDQPGLIVLGAAIAQQPVKSPARLNQGRRRHTHPFPQRRVRASLGRVGFNCRNIPRRRPTSTTSPTESRSAARSPGAICDPCPTAYPSSPNHVRAASSTMDSVNGMTVYSPAKIAAKLRKPLENKSLWRLNSADI